MLVLLPHQAESFSSVFNHLSPLKDIFSDLKISFLLPISTEGFMSTLKNYEVIPLKKEDLGWLGLPRVSYTKNLENFGFDMCLDLDLSKNFTNAYLSFKSKAEVRMGVQGKMGVPFYNLELILPSHLLYLDQQYDSVIRILKNLRMEKTVEA
jgi:ADP-heptose:LPS heptosyltransferase